MLLVWRSNSDLVGHTVKWMLAEVAESLATWQPWSRPSSSRLSTRSQSPKSSRSRGVQQFTRKSPKLLMTRGSRKCSDVLQPFQVSGVQTCFVLLVNSCVASCSLFLFLVLHSDSWGRLGNPHSPLLIQLNNSGGGNLGARQHQSSQELVFCSNLVLIVRRVLQEPPGFSRPGPVRVDGLLNVLLSLIPLQVSSGQQQQRLWAVPSPPDLRGGAKNHLSQSQLIISDQVTSGPMTRSQEISSSAWRLISWETSSSNFNTFNKCNTLSNIYCSKSVRRKSNRNPRRQEENPVEPWRQIQQKKKHRKEAVQEQHNITKGNTTEHPVKHQQNPQAPTRHQLNGIKHLYRTLAETWATAGEP